LGAQVRFRRSARRQKQEVFETDGRTGLGGRVVKLFTWAAGLPAQVVQDFTREAMRVADLHNPHVAQVLDAGTFGDGTPFVVMERLAGMTLDEAISVRSLQIAEVLPIFGGVGAALSAAYSAGVAHGQLRADNVFIADAVRHGPPCPKLLDFGVARLVAQTHEIGRGVDPLGHRALSARINSRWRRSRGGS
jgi:serine/threonine protein kinase